MKDLTNNVDIRRAISPVVVSDNTPQVSQVIDLHGYRSATFAIAIGAVADAETTFAVLLEDSDYSDSFFASVPDADLLGTELLAGFQFDDDNEVRKLGYVGAKRYLRLTITPSGNSGAANIAALAILGHPLLWPVA